MRQQLGNAAHTAKQTSQAAAYAVSQRLPKTTKGKVGLALSLAGGGYILYRVVKAGMLGGILALVAFYFTAGLLSMIGVLFAVKLFKGGPGTPSWIAVAKAKRAARAARKTVPVTAEAVA